MKLRPVYAIALALVLAGCGSASAPEEPVRPVRSIVVTAEPLTPESTFSGEVRARYETPLGFRVGGKLLERAVDVGDIVKKGQFLARLDPKDLRLSAEAGKAALLAAQADFRRAQADYERYEKLYQRQLISASEYKLQKTNFEVAESRMKQAAAQYDVDANQAAYAELHAEFNGVVTRLDAEIGQVLAAGQAVVSLARPEELEVEISIPESRVDEVRNAATLTVSIWANKDLRVPGKVREIAPDTDPVTRTYRARVAVPTSNTLIKLGMTANVHIKGSEDQVIRLPLTAIYQPKQKPTVWVVDEKTATVHNLPITITRYADNDVVVESGLQPGQRVVTAGVHKLVEGQKIRLGESL